MVNIMPDTTSKTINSGLTDRHTFVGFYRRYKLFSGTNHMFPVYDRISMGN